MKNFLIQRHRIIIPLGVILTGFLLRLYSLQHSYAINSDGMLYIQQAKAFHYGQYDSLTTCYQYLNSLFVYISIGYRMFGDWLVAANVVSLFFSTITMVPLYLLLRRFLDFSVASCTLLVFAVNPVLIEMSSRVIRDPSFWFFLTLGIYSFILSDIKKKYFILIFSCLSFFLASLARFEAIVFIPATLAFLLFTPQVKKWEKVGYFLTPLFLIVLLTLCVAPLMGYDLKQWFYPRSVFKPFVLAIEKYEQIRHGLTSIGNEQSSSFWSHHFFPTASNLLWWIGLGSVIVEIVRTFFEPFFLLYALGLKGIRKRLKNDKMLLYLLFLAIATFLVLYLHELGHWTMRGRFIVFFFIPTFVLIGYGIENFFSLLGSMKNVEKKYLYFVLGIVIFIIPLSKNMDENREDKKIFQNIGNHISLIEDSLQEVGVAAAFDADDIKLISFFANLSSKGVSCVRSSAKKIDPCSVFSNGYLREKGVSYLVWDEKNWTNEDFERLKKEIACTEIKGWQDWRLGRLVLFKIHE